MTLIHTSNFNEVQWDYSHGEGSGFLGLIFKDFKRYQFSQNINKI